MLGVRGTVSEELVGKATVSACLPGAVFPGHGEVGVEDLWVSPRCECCVVEEGGVETGSSLLSLLMLLRASEERREGADAGRGRMAERRVSAGSGDRVWLELSGEVGDVWMGSASIERCSCPRRAWMVSSASCRLISTM
jgi:hypothetical protein